MASVKKHRKTGKGVTFLVVLLLSIIAALVILFFNNRYQNQCVLYWDGYPYQFKDTYADALPENAVYLGEAKYIQYREGLGEDLTSNLIDISPTAKEMVSSDQRGKVYYDAASNRIFVAVNTEPNQDPAQYYFVFYD